MGFHIVWKGFCQARGEMVSLFSVCHPQINSQAAQAKISNQRSAVSHQNPCSWSTHLPWTECTHNSQTSATTGMSPFQCAMGFQPPLFPAQEDETSDHMHKAHLHHCQRCGKMPMLLYFSPPQPPWDMLTEHSCIPHRYIRDASLVQDFNSLDCNQLFTLYSPNTCFLSTGQPAVFLPQPSIHSLSNYCLCGRYTTGLASCSLDFLTT